MTWFEPQTSGIGSNHSANWATTSTNLQNIFLSFLGKFRTIFYLAIIYIIGELVLTLGAVGDTSDGNEGLEGMPAAAVSFIGLFLIAIGRWKLAWLAKKTNYPSLPCIGNTINKIICARILFGSSDLFFYWSKDIAYKLILGTISRKSSYKWL